MLAVRPPMLPEHSGFRKKGKFEEFPKVTGQLT